MNWTNYHSHTNYSDGSHAPEVFITQALSHGLLAYGISDHGPNPLIPKGNVTEEQIKDYVEHIRQLQDKYKGRIQIYCGLEVDYVPGYMSVQHECIQQAGLDYTVGSVHHIDLFSDNTLFGFEGSHVKFSRGLRELFEDNIQRLLERYFELIRLMVQEACPTIVAHLDRIKRNNMYQPFFTEKEDWYRKAVEDTIAVIAESNAIVEINTKSFYKKYTTDPDPSLWIAELLLEHNIPIHLSSDTHHPDDIIGAFDEVRSKLKKIGFTHTKVLLDGEWQDQPLEVGQLYGF